MADNTEELEPLFDYTRVQPRDFICLDDDDSDTSPFPAHKRRKAFNNPKPGNTEVDDDDEVQVIENGNIKDKDKDEEDWLQPPPKMSDELHNRLGEDSTIRELRLRKQELESLAKSGMDAVRATEESVRRELSSSVSVNAALENAQPVKGPCERAKIIISIQDKEELKQFRVYKDDKFERLFKVYADKAKLDIQKLSFSFDGDKISPVSTPDSLGMEDDDIIEVHVKSS